MLNKKLIIFGSTSSIAQLVIPHLGLKANNIYSIDRNREIQVEFSFVPPENRYEIEFFANELSEQKFSKIFKQFSSEECIILNFMGKFGSIETLKCLNIGDVLQTQNDNLLPFLLIAKFANWFQPGTSIISFSGAGVGGDKIDDSSLGYLSAKASMAILAEAIDSQLAFSGIRFGLIAPGAFPSPMQDIVAKTNNTNISNSRIANAQKVMDSLPNTKKLIELIRFLISNPEQLGGRTWSANFDELTPKTDNFGKLRRIY